VEIQGRAALLESGPPGPQWTSAYWETAGNQLLSVAGYEVSANVVLRAAEHVSFVPAGVVQLPVTPGEIVGRARALAATERAAGRTWSDGVAKLSSWTELDGLATHGNVTLEATGALAAVPWHPIWAVLFSAASSSAVALVWKLVVVDAASGSVQLDTVRNGPATWFLHLTDRGPRIGGCPGGSNAAVPFGVFTRQEAVYVATPPTSPAGETVSVVVKLTTVVALNHADPSLYGGCFEQNCDLDELVWPSIETVHALPGHWITYAPFSYPPGAGFPRKVRQVFGISVPGNSEGGPGPLPSWVAKLKDLAPPLSRAPGPHQAPAPSAVLARRRFSDRYLSLTYPGSWQARAYTETSSFTMALVFLSAQPMHPPCATIRRPGQTTVSCGSPVGRLRPGSVLVTWDVDGFSGWTLERAPGVPTRVGGLPAKESVVAGSGYCVAGTAEQITVDVARSVPGKYYEMSACLGKAHLAQESAEVQAMLRSVQFLRR
jgi:hypothetical protein